MELLKPADGRKRDVPVITQRGSTTEVSARSSELHKVISLLEDPLTASLKERHLFILKKLLNKNNNGFLLRELTGIARVLQICTEKVNEHPEYLLILCEALKLCRLPFLKERASDELDYAQDVTDFFSHLGYLMRVCDAEVRLNVIESVKSFYSCVPLNHQLDSMDNPTKPKSQTHLSKSCFSTYSLRFQQTSPGYRLQLLELSDLPRTLLLSMAALENQPALKPQLLKTLQILSNSSDANCASILHARGAETICLHMNEPDQSGQVLPLSSEILCNLLGRGNKEEVSTQLSSLDCVLSLKEAFSYILQSASQQSDLQLRNDLLMITTVVAENPNSALMESLLAQQLVHFITLPEEKSPSCVAHNLGLTYKNENFKMKKMLLNLLIPLSKDLTALQLYEDERVMLSLLMLVRPPGVLSEHQPGSRHWSSIQQEELQLQALVTLTAIAPLMLNDFMSYQGNNYLLLLLDWCVESGASYFPGQSFNAREGKRNKKTQMLHCIRVLQSVTFQGVEFVNQDLCDQGAIHQLLEILMQMEARTYEDDEVAVEIMSDIQLLLSTLCETDLHRKELFGFQGAEMAIQFLRKGSSKFYSGLGHNKLILSTVDCVWSGIVGCYHTEDYFLEKEGVFLLLDLLSTSPRCVHGVVLSTLLDLCDNPNTLPHLLSWRDGTGQTAPRLLLQLWREEEEELGVSRNRHGGIVDPQRPLLNCFQQNESDLTFSSNKASLAVMEVSENLRAKIYFIFYYLGFQELPGLSTEDYVTLSIVKRYLDFKVGEVWEEISREVRRENVWLFSDDEEALTNICKASEDTARKVVEEQNHILEQRQKEDIRKETLFYTEIKSHQKQEALMAKSWDSYVSRTSSYKVLKEVKAHRESYSESTRPKVKDEEAVNRPTKHFIGHILAVESTGAKGPAGVRVKLGRTAIKAKTAI
uniref:Cilia- and flagella-associated protein 69 ARM repeats domain-containing protein n=1 Tax=Oryzias latipes TaxID=8090 RepID=A0A3P9KSL4_ORYLA